MSKLQIKKPLFKVFLKLRIHPLFWVVAAVAVLTAHFTELLMLLGIILIHEMGHGVCAQFFSWRIKRIRILPFGGVAEMEEYGNRPLKEELAVILAGPLQHIWMTAAMYALYMYEWVPEDVFFMFMEFNIMILLFNLLPVWPLDGGKLLLMGLSLLHPYSKAFQQTLLFSVIVLMSLHLFSLFIFPMQLNLWIVLCYLYFSLWMEWKQRPFILMRFLLERHYGKKPNFMRLSPLNVDAEDSLSEVLSRFKRGVKHPIIVIEGGAEIGSLDENELLHAYFTEKMVTAKVKDIMQLY
ncbi:site-2 protease family protein [Falsibacillus pallidus]|uniref:site-2 protease family protein n=1 Tax=Falsibacillus pallidus TaxID=493781 RepID=UPI003D976565